MLHWVAFRCSSWNNMRVMTSFFSLSVSVTHVILVILVP